MPLQEVRFSGKDVEKLFRSETRLTKLGRLAKRTLVQLLALVVLYGLFFGLINAGAYWTRLRFALAEKPNPNPVVSEPIAEPEPEVIYPSEVIIPKLGLTAPLHINVLPSQTIATLQNGVVHYADTALPGQIGNTVIFGHSSDFPWSPGLYKNVFALLDQLVVGDLIVVPYTTQKFVYQVETTSVVRPSDLSVLKKTATPQLTLITCYPVGTTQRRLIITAKLIQGTPTGEQMVEPLIQELPRVR